MLHYTFATRSRTQHDRPIGAAAPPLFRPRSHHPLVKNILHSSSHAVGIQAKLTVGEANDKYEQEADHIAEQVMRMPNPRRAASAGRSLVTRTVTGNGIAQRVCAPCAAEYQAAARENRGVEPTHLCPRCRSQDEQLLQASPIPESLQRQESPEEEEEEFVQAKRNVLNAPEVTTELNHGISALRYGGQPLPASERRFFEPRFRTNFSSVRVHNDTRAADMARAINARAFTLGSNIVFGAGEYSPGATRGRKLLAHELTHVVQQSGVTRQSPDHGVIQRFEVKTEGQPPHHWTTHVPEDELERLARAQNILFRVVHWHECRDYFRDNTPGGTDTTAQTLYNNAELWKHPSQASNLYGEGELGGSIIAYTRRAYDISHWTLAGTFVHELMHNGGQADEQTCENALHPCGRLPQVPVGQRDSGGFAPVRPGLPFFMAEVQRILNDPDYYFSDFIGGAAYGCLGDRISVDPNNSFWANANTAEVRNAAQDAVDLCIGSPEE